jgi:dUTP pyrophosphatase
LAVKVGISYLPHYGDLPKPSRMTSGSSGYDMHAACKEDIIIRPGETAMVPTGVRLAVPANFEAQIRPRSGLALKKRVGILNSPGTVDSDYRGEVGIILHNFGDREFTVRRGDRIAQMVICELPEARLEEHEELSGTSRGDGGFGHTG